MVTSELTIESNEHLLFLLPGQSMSPKAFWDFKLPDGKTHAEYIVEAGVDVILFDPVGYGDSHEFFNYDRIEYANQIESAMAEVTKQYKTKTIFGFSTSTAPALVAASRGLFDKVIIHSPSIRNDKKYYVKHGEKFETGIKKLKTERLEKISNKLMENPFRLDGWEESIIDAMGGEEWVVPAQVVYDINNYWVDHGDNGFDASKVPPILAIKGEFDYESTTGGYDEFMKLFPEAQEVEIPYSTHFSMWETTSAITRLEMIKYCLTINQK
jgi:pimeloyl-ACP methyl ester carboxylesterase